MVVVIILLFTLLTSWNIISGVAVYVGKGFFNYGLLPFSLKEKFRYLPLIALDVFNLPTPVAIGLLSIFYLSKNCRKEQYF